MITEITSGGRAGVVVFQADLGARAKNRNLAKTLDILSDLHYFPLFGCR
jgi:hypothetical protein